MPKIDDKDFVKRAGSFNDVQFAMGIAALTLALLVFTPLSSYLIERGAQKTFLQQNKYIDAIKTETNLEKQLLQIIKVDDQIFRRLSLSTIIYVRVSVFTVLLVIAGSCFASYYHFKRFLRIVDSK